LEYQFYTLKNGIRIAHKQVRSNVAHLGIIINSGTRDELANENGLAHFIEHTIFKGTKKRKSYQVLARLENIGGDLNAFTTKEDTIFFGSFLKRYYNRTADLLADILFNSIFPENEIEIEKNVVIEEIKSYKDSPAELIFDEFENQIFKNHPIGRNILGDEKTIKTFSRSSIINFINRTYNTDQMFIASVGNISFKRLVEILENNFGNYKQNIRNYYRKYFDGYTPSNIFKKIKSHQAHCVIGSTSYSINDNKRVAFNLLNNILGGPGLNTRLNISIREKKGLAYNVESQFSPMTDTGLFTIYIGSQQNSINKSIELVFDEFKKFREKKLGSIQLSIAKKQFIGQIALMNESNQNEMLAMAKSGLNYDRIETLKDINNKILKISDIEILEVANEMLIPEKMSILIYNKENGYF